MVINGQTSRVTSDLVLTWPQELLQKLAWYSTRDANMPGA
jgi:hypothetical protein